MDYYGEYLFCLCLTYLLLDLHPSDTYTLLLSYPNHLQGDLEPASPDFCLAVIPPPTTEAPPPETTEAPPATTEATPLPPVTTDGPMFSKSSKSKSEKATSKSGKAEKMSMPSSAKSKKGDTKSSKLMKAFSHLAAISSKLYHLL